jgi:hypothetical protein
MLQPRWLRKDSIWLTHSWSEQVVSSPEYFQRPEVAATSAIRQQLNSQTIPTMIRQTKL